MSESKSDERLWLKRSDKGDIEEVMTGSEREKERNENKKVPETEEPGEPDEEAEARKDPVWKGKPVLSAFYPFYLIGGLALLCTTVAALALPLPLWIVGVLLPLSFFVIVLPFVLCLAWTFTLTSGEAKSEFRLWVGRSRSAPLDKVTDVVTKQGVMARLFGFGTVRMDTAGAPFQGVNFWGIRTPFEIEKKVRRIMDEHKDEQR